MTLDLSVGTVDLDARELRRGVDVVRLTAIEGALLAYLAGRSGEVVSRQDLLRDVWGYADGVRTRTVYTTVNRLRKKIESDPSDPRHLQTAGRQGYRFVADTVAPTPVPARAVVLPADRFVGREAELAALRAAAAEGARVVTVTGPGGAGKTRLLLHLGAGLDGAVFVDLTECRTAAAVRAALAAGLAHRGDPTDAALAVAARGRTVLLDNAEQAVDAVAELVGALRARSDVRFVVTSRVRLRVTDERLIELGPLAEVDAVALLEARSGRPLPDDEREAARALVAALDGLPLAIEIAAARLRLLPPSRLLARLTALDLGRGLRGRADRHASLRATLDWSWDLLPDAARSALAQLSVFRGGFTLAGADAVLRLGDVDPLDVLEELIDHSLVVPVDAPGPPRFRLFVAVREYAAERVDDPRGLADRHAAWALRVAGGAARSELDNLRAALARVLGSDDDDAVGGLAGAVATITGRTGPSRADLPVLERALVRLSGRPAARLATSLGYLQSTLGDPDRAAATLDTADAHLAGLPAGTPTRGWLAAQVAFIRAQVQLARTDWSGAIAHSRQAADGFRAEGARANLARALDQLGACLVSTGELAEAHAVLAECAVLTDDTTRVNAYFGLLHAKRGDHAAAREHYGRAITDARGPDASSVSAVMLGRLGEVHLHAGELALAEACTAEAVAALEDCTVPARRSDAFGRRGAVLVALGRHAEAVDLVAPLLSMEGGFRGRGLSVVGDAAAADGRLAEAHACWTEAARLGSYDPCAHARSLARIGELELALGDRAGAEGRLAEAESRIADLDLLPDASARRAVVALAEALTA